MCFKVKAITLIQSLLICSCSTENFCTMFIRLRGTCPDIVTRLFDKRDHLIIENLDHVSRWFSVLIQIIMFYGF